MHLYVYPEVNGPLALGECREAKHREILVKTPNKCVEYDAVYASRFNFML